MARALLMYKMTPDSTPEGMVMVTDEALSVDEMAQRIKEAMECIVPGGENEPSPPDGCVVSFVPFHERGFMTPPHRFLQGLLHYYGIELQHLNPMRFSTSLAFIALCERYLGIEPHFELW